MISHCKYAINYHKYSLALGFMVEINIINKTNKPDKPNAVFLIASITMGGMVGYMSQKTLQIHFKNIQIHESYFTGQPNSRRLPMEPRTCHGEQEQLHAYILWSWQHI